MDEAQLRGRMEEFRDRYLRRTLKELTQLHDLLGGPEAGGPATMREVEVIVHRINGSGAMLGFPAVSTAAAALEQATAGHAASQRPISSEQLADCKRLLDQLETATTHALDQAQLNT